jgi:hypothetical protein
VVSVGIQTAAKADGQHFGMAPWLVGVGAAYGATWLLSTIIDTFRRPARTAGLSDQARRAVIAPA